MILEKLSHYKFSHQIFHPKQKIIKHDPLKRLATVVSNQSVKYYRTCDDIFARVPLENDPTIFKRVFNEELKNFDLKDINFLDYKLSIDCFCEEYEDLLFKYLNTGEKRKQLHISNEVNDLFLNDEWSQFVDLINAFGAQNEIHLEIFNILYSNVIWAIDYRQFVDNIDLSLFRIVDLYVIINNKEGYYYNIKCDESLSLEEPLIPSSFIKYNPYSKRSSGFFGKSVDDDTPYWKKLDVLREY